MAYHGDVGRGWEAVAATAIADVGMLRTELIVGYLVAGYAAALVPPGWLAAALHAVGAVPYAGYVLLLTVGLLIAVATFICSMGNVPIARFLANAGIPLGANTTFIYGDLLILPLIAIYRKSFPPRVRGPSLRFSSRARSCRCAHGESYRAVRLGAPRWGRWRSTTVLRWSRTSSRSRPSLWSRLPLTAQANVWMI